MIRECTVRIGGIPESARIYRLTKSNLDGVKSEAAAARPGFECAADPDRQDWRSHLNCQDRRPFLELRELSVDGPGTFWKNEQVLLSLESSGAGLHCSDKVGVRIDCNDVAGFR